MILVYTCDIIGSRNYAIADRQTINLLIKEYFSNACQLFPKTKADYLSFAITQGDEFQFTADKFIDFYKFLLYFRSGVALSGIKPTVFFRCGIGIGEKATKGNNSYEMDGSAFYNSRLALNELKAKGNLNKLTRLQHPKKKLSILLNSVLMFCDELEKNWSYEQRKVVLETLTGKSQVQIATDFDNTKQNINKLLKNAKWEFVVNAIKSINFVLQ